nr:RNA-directed DNA polymerase, eukaryota [Tanacetum cinerariifolium]
WVKSVPIKVNITAWKVKSNAFPTRFNISRRGMYIDSMVCPICNTGVETTNHIFFQCVVVRQIMRKISSWWNIDYSDMNSYEEWRVWLVSIRIQSKLKGILEGVYFGLWWTQDSGAGDEDYYSRALLDYEAEHGMSFTLFWDASINLNVDVGDDEEDEVQELRRSMRKDKVKYLKKKWPRSSGSSSSTNDEALATLMVSELAMHNERAIGMKKE